MSGVNEPVVVDGVAGRATYLDENLNPTPKEKATWVRIWLVNGKHITAEVKQQPKQPA